MHCGNDKAITLKKINVLQKTTNYSDVKTIQQKIQS